MSETLRFDGKSFDTTKDGARLTSQFERVLSVMQDGAWHTLAEIANRVSYPPYEKASEAGVSARIRDLRKPRFGGYVIQRRRLRLSGTWEYRMLKREAGQSA